MSCRLIDGPVKPHLLGDGMCRGPAWTFGVWPIVKGRMTKKKCAEACASTKGCLGFDLSEPKKNAFDCHLYGHHPVGDPLPVHLAKCQMGLKTDSL